MAHPVLHAVLSLRPLLFQVFAQTSITFLLSEQLLIFMMLKCLCSDYGFEQSHMETDRCIADFWYDPDSPPEDCHLGQTYMSSTGSVLVDFTFSPTQLQLCLKFTPTSIVIHSLILLSVRVHA